MRFLATLLLCLFVLPANAKPSRSAEFAGDRYVARIAQAEVTERRKPKVRYLYRTRGKTRPQPRQRRYEAPLTMAQGFRREVTAATQVIGGRPAGCPARFCGCGASIHLFGRIVPRLNLAANWLSFPRSAPAPNMVAARRGHVFVLKQHIAGNKWLVHDSNSGGRRTRIHPRSIAGYAIVNPRA